MKKTFFKWKKQFFDSKSKILIALPKLKSSKATLDESYNGFKVKE